MNEIINKFFLVRNKFMPEMHLRQSEFTYSALDQLQKLRKNTKIKKNWRFTIYLSKRTR